MDKTIPEAVVTDALIADLLPAALIFAENEEHLDHARQRAKTILLKALTAAQQQGQARTLTGAQALALLDKIGDGVEGSARRLLGEPQPMQQGGGEEAEALVNMLASLAWSSHPRGLGYVVERMPKVYAAIRSAPPSAPVGVDALWACGFCGATYRLDSLCCDAQREFRATQHQEPTT